MRDDDKHDRFQEHFQDGTQYLSFLLRLWQDNPAAPWRVSLYSVLTAETVVFANPAELYAYLDKLTQFRTPDAPG